MPLMDYRPATSAGGGANNPTLAESATQYVATDGNDSHDGLSWHTAKLTIQAAISALTVNATDGYAAPGIVEVGAGTFTVSSSHRTVTGSCISGQSTISSASFTSADVGALVVQSTACPAASVGGTSIPIWQIIAVSSGVATVAGSNNISPGVAGTVTNGSFTIIRPGVYVPAGVTLRGRGSYASSGQNQAVGTLNPNWDPVVQATCIQDIGTDITMAVQTGNGEGGNTLTAIKQTIQGMSIWGTMNYVGAAGSSGNVNTFGLWTNFNWYVIVEDVDLSHHGQWGLVLQGNGIAMARFEDMVLSYNGQLTSTNATGGLVQTSGAALATLSNCSFMTNFGFHALDYSGIWIGCTTAACQTTGYSGTGAGISIWLPTAPLNSLGVFVGCWFEDDSSIYAQVGIGGNTIAFSFLGCMFEGSGAGRGLFVESQVSMENCIFQGHSLYGVDASANNYLVNWRNCTCADTTFLKTPTQAYPGAAATEPGSIGLGTVSAPPAPSSVALTPGTAWQNTTGTDVLLDFALSFPSSGGTAQFLRGPHGSAANLPGPVTKSGSSIECYEVRVPYQYDFQVNTPNNAVNSTIGQSSNATSVTSASMNTTGASLLIIALAWYAAGATAWTVQDSKSNTYSLVKSQLGTDGASYVGIYASASSPTVGTGHTFSTNVASGGSGNTYPSIVGAAFQFTTGGVDQNNGNGAVSSNTIQTGSVTPAHNGELILAAAATLANPGSFSSIDSGLTVMQSAGLVPANAGGIGFAWMYQTTAAAINPKWSGTFTGAAAAVGTFQTTSPGVIFSGNANAQPV